MAASNFITQLDLKDNTVIQGNVEPSLLTPFIQVTQEIHLLPILGRALYDVMLDDLIVMDGRILAVSARFIALLPYVQDAATYCTAAEATPFLATRITNKGVNRKAAEFSNPASEGEVKDLQARFSNYGDEYKARLECFIIENVTTYPEYRERDSCEDGCRCPKHFHYFSGFQFDKKH